MMESKYGLANLKCCRSWNDWGSKDLGPRVFDGVCANMGKAHQNPAYPRLSPPKGQNFSGNPNP